MSRPSGRHGPASLAYISSGESNKLLLWSAVAAWPEEECGEWLQWDHPKGHGCPFTTLYVSIQSRGARAGFRLCRLLRGQATSLHCKGASEDHLAHGAAGRVQHVTVITVKVLNRACGASGLEVQGHCRYTG